MLDQSFSGQNFNTIFLRENRKGTFKRDYFTAEYLEKHEDFKAVIIEKNHLKAANGILTAAQLDDFQKRCDAINKEKELIRAESFQKISLQIHEKDFEFNLEYKPNIEIFVAEETAAVFFAIKQLQTNISKTFRVVQSNRDYIIKQLYSTVSDGYPKVIVRTDIESFYESIPQDRLLKRMDDSTLLSPLSKKLVKKLFYEYENVKDAAKIQPNHGIPRGVGLSPYLAEVYLKDVDSEIQSLDDLIFYSRYVDDIIAVFCPKTQSTKRNYEKEIKKIVSEYKLNLAAPKTETIELLSNPPAFSKSFTYLGYKIFLDRTPSLTFKSRIEISDEKLQKYKERIVASVSDYNTSAKYNEPFARSLLIYRLKFLTGNFHLSNNKRNVKTGLFYSNAMLNLNTNGFDSLRILDRHLQANLHLLLPPPIGMNKANLVKFFKDRFNFQKSFENKQKSFYSFNFSAKEMSFYRRKYGRIVSIFEVIKSGW